MDNPERFMSNLGSLEKQSKVDHFFEEVLGLLGYDERAVTVICEIRSREIAIEGEGNDSKSQLTDDRITELTAKGRTIAVDLEIRDDFNYIQVYLTHFLTPELLTEIDQI